MQILKIQGDCHGKLLQQQLIVIAIIPPLLLQPLPVIGKCGVVSAYQLPELPGVVWVDQMA
jgi:hypothetical protein